MTLSDRVAVFNLGRIEQLGAPRHLYDAPANPFVAGFLGDNNRATVRFAGRHPDSGHARLQWPAVGDAIPLTARCGPLLAEACADGRAPAEVTLCVRPERLRLLPMAASDGGLSGMVRDAIHQGDHHRLLVDVALGEGAPVSWLVKLPPHEARDVTRGRVVRLGFQPDDAWVF
jgi:putative spermidine/putrescine transport system ATP-binding protein